MLNGAEIQASLSDLEAYFGGEEKHMDRGLARAAANDLENELRPAAEGVPRRDKGSHSVYRHPKAAEGLNIIARILEAIDMMDPTEGQRACADFRKLAVTQKWI